MHPTLIEWLQQFENCCNTKTPTGVYNALVQLGVEMPNSTNVAPRTGNRSGCDCESSLADLRMRIEDLEKELLSFDSVILRERLFKLLADEAFAVSLHNAHAEYNRRAHEILRVSGMLPKVRAALLRDIRGGVQNTFSDGVEYYAIVQKDYGELLKNFLVKNPQGWF